MLLNIKTGISCILFYNLAKIPCPKKQEKSVNTTFTGVYSESSSGTCYLLLWLKSMYILDGSDPRTDQFVEPKATRV